MGGKRLSAAFVNVMVFQCPQGLKFPLMKIRSSNVSAPSLNVTAVIVCGEIIRSCKPGVGGELGNQEE